MFKTYVNEPFLIEPLLRNHLQQNQGKLLYVVFWATWADQCLTEMPYTKDLYFEFTDKGAAFAHICLESAERQWKTVFDKYEPGGQYYLLSNQQSAEIRKRYGIKSFPFYVLIDKNGNVKEKGCHLKPLIARDKIKGIL